MLSLLRRAVIVLILVLGMIWLGLLAFVRFVGRPDIWWLEILDTFALYAFAPFVGVVLAAAIVRSRSLAVLAAAAALLFGIEFGSLLLPRTPPTEASGPHLKVLTYNVLATNRDPDPLLGLVRAERPDVVVLQELTAPYANRLRAQLADEYRFSVVDGVQSRNAGGGVFSRLPIVDHEAFRLTNGGNVHQRVRLRTEAGVVWLVNVHLLSPRLEARRLARGRLVVPRDFHDERRDEELDRLVAEVRKLDGPFVLAGDLNTAAGSRPNRRFPDSWRDAYREAGEGFGHTFPTEQWLLGGRVWVPFPLVRIDYVLTSPELTPRSARVPWIPGSDHLPVIADLALPSSR
ncbi:MAG: endonuclease/exonuclease/phosphatase family protein [Chloroflexota bacterium]|nr:endonuclease/exonuclease/phosphatase family protein [Chloroflexota bacterium]